MRRKLPNIWNFIVPFSNLFHFCCKSLCVHSLFHTPYYHTRTKLSAIKQKYIHPNFYINSSSHHTEQNQYQQQQHHNIKGKLKSNKNGLRNKLLFHLVIFSIVIILRYLSSCRICRIDTETQIVLGKGISKAKSSQTTRRRRENKYK